MMKIPFSPPDITEAEIQEVAAAMRSGWITTGPRTKELEKRAERNDERRKYGRDQRKDNSQSFQGNLPCGNAEARSSYQHFRALFKHNVSYVIIEAKICKRRALSNIFALNLTAFFYIIMIA